MQDLPVLQQAPFNRRLRDLSGVEFTPPRESNTAPRYGKTQETGGSTVAAPGQPPDEEQTMQDSYFAPPQSVPMAIAQRLGGGAEASRPGSAAGAAEIIDALEIRRVISGWLSASRPNKPSPRSSSSLRRVCVCVCYGVARTSHHFSPSLSKTMSSTEQEFHLAFPLNISFVYVPSSHFRLLPLLYRFSPRGLKIMFGQCI